MSRERELKTAEEIRDEVQRRLDARIAQSWDPEDAGTVTVQLPHRLAEPDERGCNWGIRGVTGDQGYRKLAGIGVHEVMAMWNLA
ncbi:hypothetical protein SAMN05518669_103417 [Variovorax sp. YR634]|uniref:hypothetical protein n=1 Tax=Variovorax sp. YR634 TaxID=1884385 RepID=UPI000897AC8C|nr:hypothetical protein [Variovorax sp. YR634]SDX15400.1 hypothetical protein SAMN05518669_103417 [Variovorax sp. YR634]